MADDEEKAQGHFANEPSPGELLRAARLEKKLDTKEVAATLNVDPWMLDALEHDEYGALGAPVFAKGHLRKYAKALGLDGDDLMVAYYQRAGTREAPPLIAESILRVEASNGARIPWLASAAGVLALAILALGVFMFLQPNRGAENARAATAQVPEVGVTTSTSDDARSTTLRLPGATAQGASTPAVEAPSAREPAATEPPPSRAEPAPVQTEPAQTNTQSSRSTLATTATTAPTRVARAPDPEPVTAATRPDRITISLAFRGESWVEVYDGKRVKLLYGMGEAGTTRSLEGPGPLNVFLGKAGDVDVSINGRPYSVPRISRLGTARFEVDASSQ